ncbi:MAG: NAD(P)(+) transhydrogenase (Re/Si-specific) subunit alpha, partial [Thermaurantiacus tibetensis]
MKIAVLKETAAGERRVAATPETVKKLAALGAEVAVEAGAGVGADIPDAEFEAAGAKVALRSEVLAGAGLVLAIQGPEPEGLPKGALLAASLNPYQA